MRLGTSVLASVCTCLLAGACGPATGAPVTGAPARLVAGVADTVVVNNVRPVHLPVRVFDKQGRPLSDTAVRYAWASGDAMTISASGLLTCPRRSDATIRATIGHLSSLIAVRCRPVAAVRFPGSIEIVLGDSAQVIPFTAYGPDNRPVALLAARITVEDTAVVALDGVRVRGRAGGNTLLSVSIGDQRATTGLRVYSPVTTLDGLQRERQLVAVPLRLERGEMRRWALPAGGWILSMFPPEDDSLGLRLRVEGARCELLTAFGPRHYHCVSNQAASVIVYAPWLPRAKAAVTGVLAVKPDAQDITRAPAVDPRAPGGA
jgi:hypothetical protein